MRKYWAAVMPTMQRPTAAYQKVRPNSGEPWLTTMVFSRGPLRDGLPWMVFPAIDFIENLLSKDSSVFEYGAGGSSMFYASRVKELVSVEHDSVWFKQTEAAMAAAQRRYGVLWTGILAVPEPQEPKSTFRLVPDPTDPRTMRHRILSCAIFFPALRLCH